MKYKIAIPTHRRSNTIGDLTLKLLEEFEPTDIYLFISDVEDFGLYLEKYPQYNLVLTDTKNVRDKFNFVQNYFNDEWVVVMEDDIKKVKDLYNRHLRNILWSCITFCDKRKYKAWGVYPSSNEFFMKKDIEVGLTYLVANMFAFKAEKTDRLDCVLNTKNDYERSILYYNFYGSTVRFNFLSCQTNNYSNKGGMQTEKEIRAELEKEASEALCEKYPHIFTINTNRKSVYTELKMNKNVIKIKG
jgi:hypothetical protein